MKPETAEIVVEGYPKPYKSKEVENTVVYIGGKWFFKHDKERVIRLVNKDGKKRFYRVDSPLLVFDSETQQRIFKADAYLTEDGVWLNKKSENVLEIDGKYHRRAYCIQASVDGKKK